MILDWFTQLTAPTSLAYVRDFREEHLISLDDPETTLESIQADRRWPLLFSTHPQHPQYYMIKADLDQDKMIPNIRTLKILWSTVIPDALLKNGKPVYDPDPLRRPVQVSAGYYNVLKTKTMCYGMAIGQDTTAPTLPAYDPNIGPPKPNVKITTTAGEPIFMQIEEEVRIFRCRKNVSQLPAFMGKGGMFTNSDSVKFQGLTFVPYELLLCHIQLSVPRFEYGKVYYINDFSLMVSSDTDGWCEKKRNAGFHEKWYLKKETPSTVPDGRPTVTYTPYLKAIRIGPIENASFPSQAVLLTPDGIAYRSPGTGQNANTPQKDRTGPVMTTESGVNGGVGLTDQDWAQSELKFYPRMAIPFAKYVQLT